MRNFKTETFEEAAAYDRHSDQQYNCGLLLINELGIKWGSTVLDVGAGTGRLAMYVAGLIGQEGSYFGIDISPERIKIAKNKADNLQGSNLFFDAVYMNSVFHWISDKKLLFDECSRVLKPGGRLGFTSQVKDLPRNNVREIARAILKKRGYDIRVLNRDNYPVTLDEARILLEQTGFLVRNIEIRKTTDNFASSEDAFNSLINRETHRNFLRYVPVKQHIEIRNELLTGLKKIETKDGIDFVRNKILQLLKKCHNYEKISKKRRCSKQSFYAHL